MQEYNAGIVRSARGIVSSCIYWPCREGAEITMKGVIKDFLLKMDDVHVKSTKNIDNVRPPRFEYAWEDERTMIMTYKSSRGLVDICVGLIRGVGKYFGEELEVTKISDKDIKVVFK
ncbi:MAG: heme NO-binding domain-containing protein [Actinomycetota bacterium]